MKTALIFSTSVLMAINALAQQTQADSAFAVRNWAFANTLYGQVLQNDSTNAKAWYRQAMCCYRLGNNRQAAISMQQATLNGIHGETAYFNLACFYSLVKDREGAVGALKMAIATKNISAQEIKNEPDLSFILQDTATRRMVTKLESQPDWIDENPSWSPDGSKIVFESHRFGDNAQVCIVNADGTHLRRLTNNQDYNGMPCFMPDGQKIVFSSGAQFGKTGDRNIFIMNIDGTGQTRLTHNKGHDHYPNVSPDGKQLVFNSDRDGHREIYLMNIDGTRQQRLTNAAAHSDYASWSPDGSRIIFESVRTGSWVTYIMNKDGSSQTPIAVASAPRFSPDGKKVVFHNSPYGSFEVFIMNNDGSATKQLTNNTGADSLPCFSPDGKKIVFISGKDGLQQLYMMNADGSGQKKLVSN